MPNDLGRQPVQAAQQRLGQAAGQIGRSEFGDQGLQPGMGGLDRCRRVHRKGLVDFAARPLPQVGQTFADELAADPTATQGGQQFGQHRLTGVTGMRRFEILQQVQTDPPE